MQLDENTDIENHANLIAFIRYDHENKLQEYSYCLFCKNLPSHTTSEELFRIEECLAKTALVSLKKIEIIMLSRRRM